MSCTVPLESIISIHINPVIFLYFQWNKYIIHTGNVKINPFNICCSISSMELQRQVNLLKIIGPCHTAGEPKERWDDGLIMGCVGGTLFPEGKMGVELTKHERMDSLLLSWQTEGDCLGWTSGKGGIGWTFCRKAWPKKTDTRCRDGRMHGYLAQVAYEKYLSILLFGIGKI